LSEKDLGESGMNYLLATPKADLYPKKIMLYLVGLGRDPVL